MDEWMPEIGQLVKTLHAGKSELWTDQIGMIVDKEPHPWANIMTYGVMFSDGEMSWGGKNSLVFIGWPE